MAIYHFSAQIITRSKGQSAVASASYRSGDKLLDERTGETKFYKREVQPETLILAPSHAPEWAKDRNRLWNEVEKIERNKNSQLAREINVALPNEISPENQRELIQSYVQEQFVDRGMVADIAIHRDDKNNQHAHVMLTVRQFEQDGEWGNKKRKDYELDKDGNKVMDKNGKPKYQTVSLTDWDKKENIEQWREQWAQHTNKALEKENSPERITHLSNEARGLEKRPTVHLGHVAHRIEKEGKTSHRGDINRERQEYNQNVVDLAEYRKEKEAIKERLSQKANSVEQRVSEFFDKHIQQKNNQLPETPQKAPVKTDQEHQPPIKKSADFLSAAEKINIQKAVPIVKGYVTLEKIEERRSQLDQWEKKVQQSKNYYDWKSEAFEKAQGHFNRQHSLTQKIEGHREEINSINRFNPLKFKENRLTRERAENSIGAYQKDFDEQEKKLDYYREKLQFTDKADFSTKEKSFLTEKEKATASNSKQNQEIKEQRELLNLAEKTLKQGEIREVASHYPQLKTAGKYLSYETAMKLKEINQQTGEVIPIERIQQLVEKRKEVKGQYENVLKSINQSQQGLSLLEVTFKKFEEIKKKIEQTEQSPIAKAKMMFSKEAKAEHDKDLHQRDHYKTVIETSGIKDFVHFEETKESFRESGEQKEGIEQNIENIESGNYKGGHNVGSGLLDAVLQGVQQAQQQEQSHTRQQEKQRQKQRLKGQKMFDIER